jgi:hypothetical protein
MGKASNFQIGSETYTLELDHGGLTMRVSKDGQPIGKVAAVLGASNRPTGQWSYELHSDDKTKKAPGQWYAGLTWQIAMGKMLKQAGLI